MDEKEKDLEKGQRDRRRGTVVEVSGPPRAISPPVPELVIPDLQYYLSSEMPVITPSLPPSLFTAVSCRCICRPLSSIFHSTVPAVQYI